MRLKNRTVLMVLFAVQLSLLVYGIVGSASRAGLMMILVMTMTLSALVLRTRTNVLSSRNSLLAFSENVAYQRKRASLKEYELQRDLNGVRALIEELIVMHERQEREWLLLKRRVFEPASAPADGNAQLTRIAAEVGAILDLVLIQTVEEDLPRTASEVTGEK